MVSYRFWQFYLRRNSSGTFKYAVGWNPQPIWRRGGGVGIGEELSKIHITSGPSFPEDESRNNFPSVSFTVCLEDQTMVIGF